MASSSQATPPPPSSKQQKLSLQEEAVAENDGVDRISDLPDCLLCHILSFLPTTRQAVATSILSSRWKTIWTFVPCLYLKPPWRLHDWWNADPDPISFSDVLSPVFAQHKAPYLRKFRLHVECSCDACYAFQGSYLTAKSAKLEELDLSICAASDPVGSHYSGPMLDLPHSIFSCKNLVVLKLSGTIRLNLPSSFHLPSLKILYLWLSLYNDDSDWRLLSCCPVLEDLHVFREGDLLLFWEDYTKVVKFQIFVPTLKRLRIDFRLFEFDHPDYDIEINAPALEYFHFRGDLRNIVFLEKLSCLVEAKVEVSPFENYDYREDFGDLEYYGDRVVGLLGELYNVKFLSLCYATTECLSFAYDYDLPMFHNLARLNYEVVCCNWHVLPDLLEQAPNLQDLVVDKGFPFRSDSHKSFCQKDPLDVPSDLSPHLATFYFKGFKGLKDELKFVRCILKKSTVLKKMTFRYGGSYHKAVAEKSRILKKVSNLPRRSTSCQIAFE